MRPTAHPQGGSPTLAMLVADRRRGHGLAVLVWLWGGLAGRAVRRRLAARRRRPAARGADRGCRRGSATPARRGRPRRARELPGPGGFYAALAVARGRRARVGARRGRAQAARLAAAGRGRRALGRAAAELRALQRTRRAGHASRSAAGTAGLLHAERRHALVAFGPPQSGKSAGTGGSGAARVERPGGRLVDQDRPARRRRMRGASRSGRCSCSTRSRSPAVPAHTWSPLDPAPARGTARSRSPGGWPRPASSTSEASRAATSGRSRPSSVSRRCCTRPPRPARSIESVVRWAYGQGARELHESLGAARRASARDEPTLDGAHAAYDAVRAFEAQADRTRSLDRGDRAGAAARVPLHARRAVGRRRRDHRRPAARRVRRRCT